MQSTDKAIKNLEDVKEFEQVALENRMEAQTTYQVITNGARKYGTLPAIQYLPTGAIGEKPEITSFEALFAKVTQSANLLHSLGFGSSDVLSIMLPNLPEYHYALFGAEAAGIVNPINPMLDPTHTIEILKATGSKAILTLAPGDYLGLWDKVIKISKHVESLEYILVVDRPECQVAGQPEPATTGRLKILNFNDAIAQMPSEAHVSERDIKPQDIAAYFHTGGTTGAPKIAQHTHLNQTFMAWVITSGNGGQAVVGKAALAGLPLFHVNAVLIGGLNQYYYGASVVILTADGYRNQNVVPNFWYYIDRFEVYTVSAVPTVYGAVLDIPQGQYDSSSVDYMASGAAPMPPELFRRFQEKTGITLVEGYGLTEGTCVSSRNPPRGIRKVGSVGLRLPYQYLEIAELDAEGHYIRTCQTDEIGTVIVKGPNVFPGYLQQDYNKNIFPKKGWLNTGDMGRLDTDGYLWLTGRAKDIIIRGGHNIDPALIEDALTKFEGVALAAAVGKPDPRVGELPVVFVSLTETCTATPEDLKAFARANIAEGAAAPVEVYIVDQIPLTPVGKLFKIPLKNKVITDTITTALREASIEADVTTQNSNKSGITVCVHLEDSSLVHSAKELLSSYSLTFSFEF